ncbi:RNA polymerase sigma factor [Chitinophaga arvensicola]|uniref:RNA polymerase sigma factor, sigma-70 family n=1 Tax=Chitinophaga arvensicola TaxID=29529 RepID=A0A1I0RPX0_9BACT|nr:RNA polymerase sigma factor [Chitinophaga arvensicola]SEW43319.1 RNA polymerase sigma factor, sigma-70 family [Chitinophaga arvensicola]
MEEFAEEPQLWRAIVDGDEAAFQQIYRLHFPMLYEYGMRLSANEELVKESIQQFFIKIWTNRAGLGAVKRIRPYLLVSLRGVIYNRLRDEKRRRISALEDDYDFELAFSPESVYIQKESSEQQQQALQQAMAQLTGRQKEIIFLRYYQELEYNEIAEIMNISVKGAYKLTARSLESLREILGLSVIAVICLLKIAASR